MIGQRELAMATALIFYSPAAYTGTISVLVAADEAATSGAALYNNGTAVTLTQGRVERFDVSGFESLQLKTSGTESGSRAVPVFAVLDTPC